MFIKRCGISLCLIIHFTINSQIFTHHISEHPDLNSIPTNSKMRRSSYPYISGDTFRSFCNFIIDETQAPFDSELLKNGATIFVARDYLNYFFTSIHPTIKKKYILVTHNGDAQVPGKFASFLNDERLAHWFGQNVVSDSSKMIPIPIGIANPHWPHGNVDCLKQVASIPNIQKKYLTYLNITPTHPERIFVANIFSAKTFCFKALHKNFHDYLIDLKQSHFVLSPRGNGLDCHRTWEALYCGCIPIIKHSPLDPLFENLPVILIDHWEEVTEDFLKNKLQEFSKQEFNQEKIFADYWSELINQTQKKVLEKN